MIALPLGLAVVFLFYLIFNFSRANNKKASRSKTFLIIIWFMRTRRPWARND